MSVSITHITLLLKRLEILKLAITVQDLEDINTQAVKIEKLMADFSDLNIILETGWIIELINKLAFSETMLQIDLLLHRFSGIVLWRDPEVIGLQTEIILLAAQINTLEIELGEIEKLLYEFEQRNTRELGEIALKILTFKRRSAANKAKRLKTDSDAQNEYQKAQNEEQRYKGNYQQVLANPILLLDEEQLKELKTKFKRIAKLTHPDLVDTRYEKEAAELFRRAKTAKDINDLVTICEIYDFLETGKPFTLRHEGLTEIESLRTEAKYLHHVVAQLYLKITDLKCCESYTKVIQIEDLDKYFNELRFKLMLELENIERLAA